MANILAKYTLEGWYEFNGIGRQVGEVFYCDDGKVIGSIADCNLGARGTEKLFLGYRNPTGQSLDFLKIAPGRRRAFDVKPIIWATEPKENLYNELAPKKETFNGVWLSAEGLPNIASLEKIMEETGKFPDVNKLALLDLNEMKTSWMLSNIPSSVIVAARQVGQIGEITLTRQD
ncbi:hypothetical protein KA107_02380 [Candidatus Pacearchaeota archaeon]|nr:hypothetical protein [Candidatus Pacearchaeota archaeon]